MTAAATIGTWLSRVSLALVALIVGAFLLDSVFGPKGGNPVGLGISLVVVAPIVLLIAIVGAVIRAFAGGERIRDE